MRLGGERKARILGLLVATNLSLFRMAPVVTSNLSLVAWAIVPFDHGMVSSYLDIGRDYTPFVTCFSTDWDKKQPNVQECVIEISFLGFLG